MNPFNSDSLICKSLIYLTGEALITAPDADMFDHSIGLPEAAQLVANVSKIYSPELTVGVTPVRFIYSGGFEYYHSQ